MKTNPRRDFLKKGMVALSGAALVPHTIKNTRGGISSGRAENELIYTILYRFYLYSCRRKMLSVLIFSSCLL